MHVLAVFGTRPEAIKMAPLVHALAASSDFDVTVCVTAQHRQMLDQVLKLFEIQPDIDLNLMRPGQDLFDVTSSVLLGMRPVLQQLQPDILLVHGDTTTTFAASMAGFYANIPVGHVEAGLRTHDLRAPFPEEFNRQITGRIAHWHFAPTPRSQQSLLAERIPATQIFVTGNTVIDALFWVLQRLERMPQHRQQLVEFLSRQLPFAWEEERFLLITGHRRENFGKGFEEICQALASLANNFPNIHFVYPVHLNPAVQGPVFQNLQQIPNIHLLPPLDYEPFLLLLRQAYLVLTDSGGLQEEAPSLGIPVLVMRETTERPEAITAGTVRLVGADAHRITSNVSELLTDTSSYEQMTRAHNPYGDGHACERILQALRNQSTSS